MESSEPIAALTWKQYESAFTTFIKASTEYDAICSLIKPVLETFKGKAVSLLSIGAGTGFLEERLVTEHGLKLDYFHGIESSQAHLKQLKNVVSRWKEVYYDITEVDFYPGLEILGTYDLVLMSHVMYFMEDPLAAMKKAKSLLKPGGFVVIFNQGHVGGAALHRFLSSKATLAPQVTVNHALSGKDLGEILQAAGINHSVGESPSTMDVDDFIAKRSTPTANHVVSFFIQVPFKSLSSQLQTLIYKMVKEGSEEGTDGRQKFYHPSSMVQIFD